MNTAEVANLRYNTLPVDKMLHDCIRVGHIKFDHFAASPIAEIAIHAIEFDLSEVVNN